MASEVSSNVERETTLFSS